MFEYPLVHPKRDNISAVTADALLVSLGLLGGLRLSYIGLQLAVRTKRKAL